MSQLEKAAQLVEELLPTLNNTMTICACCGFKKYNNWDDHQATVELQAMAEKLRRWDKKLST